MLLFRGRILCPGRLAVFRHWPGHCSPPPPAPVQSPAVFQGEDPARAASKGGKNTARFLPGELRAGPGSAPKRLTHSWNNFSSIWKEHMLFLLGEERVLRSFAETCRKRQALAWPQHPDFKRCAHGVFGGRTCWYLIPGARGGGPRNAVPSVLGHGARGCSDVFPLPLRPPVSGALPSQLTPHPRPPV